MRTFELAELLESLARLVRQLPDTELPSGVTPTSTRRKSKEVRVAPQQLKSLSLGRLSRYPKAELIRLIEENQIPVQIGAKDSAEVVFRRLQRYLHDNTTSKRQIRNQIVHGKTSPELTSALAYLLRDKYE